MEPKYVTRGKVLLRNCYFTETYFGLLNIASQEIILIFHSDLHNTISSESERGFLGER